MVENRGYGIVKCSREILAKVLVAKSYPGDISNDQESNCDRLLENESEESRLITYMKETLVAKGRNACFCCPRTVILIHSHIFG